MNRKTKIVVLIMFFIIILLVLVPLVINTLFKIDSGVWFVKSEWSAGDTLSFYGSILSGVLTVLGVVLTIRHEKIESQKDDSIKYKPILNFVGVDLPINCYYREVGIGYCVGFNNDTKNKEELQKKYLESQKGEKPKYTLFFQNVGRGETFNATVENYEIHQMNWIDVSKMQSNISTPQYIGEIIKDGYLAIRLKLPDYLLLPQKVENCQWFELCTKLYINYSDMFDRIKYQYIVYLSFKVMIENIETEAPEVYEDGYCYSKVRYDLYQIMPMKMIYSKQKKEFIHENKYIPE